MLLLLEEYKRLAKVFSSGLAAVSGGPGWLALSQCAVSCPCAVTLRSLPAAAMKGMKLPKNLKGDMNPRNMQQNIAQASSTGG